MPETISKLVFRSVQIHEDPQDGQRLNLTDMWRAAGGNRTNRPVNWLDSRQARDLAEFLADLNEVRNSDLIRVEKSGSKTPGGGATYAHWQLALAFAKYLSPEFHVWCNNIVRAYMEGKLVPRQQQLDYAPLLTQMQASHERALLAVVGSFQTALTAVTDERQLTDAQCRDLVHRARKRRVTWPKAREYYDYRSGPAFSTVPGRDFLTVYNQLANWDARPPRETANSQPQAPKQAKGVKALLPAAATKPPPQARPPLASDEDISVPYTLTGLVEGVKKRFNLYTNSTINAPFISSLLRVQKLDKAPYTYLLGGVPHWTPEAFELLCSAVRAFFHGSFDSTTEKALPIKH